jgi:hypothetical protein
MGRLDSSSGSEQTCGFIIQKEPVARNLARKHNSIQDQNQAPSSLAPSLEPFSSKVRSALSIDKKESIGPQRKASTPLSHYKTE